MPEPVMPRGGTGAIPAALGWPRQLAQEWDAGRNPQLLGAQSQATLMPAAGNLFRTKAALGIFLLEVALRKADVVTQHVARWAQAQLGRGELMPTMIGIGPNQVPRKDQIQAVSTRAEVAIGEVAAVGINRSGRGRRMDPRGGPHCAPRSRHRW